MKVFKTLLQVIGIGAVLAATPAFGIDVLRVKVDIPYSFQAGTANMPAGTYVIRREMGSEFLWVINKDSGKAVVILTATPVTSGHPEKAQAQFRVYAGKHYLASIWSPEHHSGRTLLPSRAEKEAAKAGVPYKIAVLSVERY